jgi:hypothetical protein
MSETGPSGIGPDVLFYGAPVVADWAVVDGTVVAATVAQQVRSCP